MTTKTILDVLGIPAITPAQARALRIIERHTWNGSALTATVKIAGVRESTIRALHLRDLVLWWDDGRRLAVRP